MEHRTVYLDNNATTPLHPEVKKTHRRADTMQARRYLIAATAKLTAGVQNNQYGLKS